MMRYCTNTDCKGDCETCNRAPVENQPLPRQYLPDERALEATMMRVRNGVATQEDAERLMCAYQCATGRLDSICEESLSARS